MKLGLVTYALHIGGIETFLMGLARKLEQMGNEVIFVEWLVEGEWSRWFEQEGFQVARVLGRPWEPRTTHARRIASALRDFDAVILNDSPVAQAALGLLDQRQVAIVVLHSCLRSMIRNAAGNFSEVDALVAVSPHVGESATRHGVPGDRIFVVPNGVDAPGRWPRSNRYKDVRDEPLRVAFVGSLGHSQKGVLHVPGIIKRVFSEGVSVLIDVVGEGSDEQALKDLIARSDVGHLVCVHGGLPHASVTQRLLDADVLLMPSYFEGLPIVLLEAMALGAVPVASRLPGCTDVVIEDGVSGALVSVGDEEGFAARIVAFARDRQLLDRVSRSAWQRTRDLFSCSKMTESYLCLIKRCQAGRWPGDAPPRSGQLDTSLLGDLPWLPVALVRPVRKLLRLAGLMPQPLVEPPFFDWDLVCSRPGEFSSRPDAGAQVTGGVSSSQQVSGREKLR